MQRHVYFASYIDTKKDSEVNKRTMKNNEVLIERIRSILSQRKGLFSEKKMFGTVCFMLNDNICVGGMEGISPCPM